MSDENNIKPGPWQDPEADGNDGSEAAPQADGPQQNAEQGEHEAEARDPLEELRAENAELRDRLLRTLAEIENIRKRAEREVRDARQYAITGFARDILSVGDNMRRALDSVDDERRTAADATLRALLDGVEMTERELLNVLERHDVKRVDPAGERFDPNLHQAMLEIQDDSVPAGTVVQVMQSGFTISGRVLRPAMVAVSKGGPKAERPAAQEEPEEDGTAVGSAVDRTA